MEKKKSKFSNLESKRFVFFQSGLIIALSLTLLAFEYSVPKTTSFLSDNRKGNMFIDEDMIVTWRKEEKKLTPPPPKKQIIEEIILIDNDKTEDNVEDFNSESGEDVAVELITIIEEPEQEAIVPFYKLEKEPSFVGGESALFEYLSKNTKFPQLANETGITGKVYIKFIVDKDGNIKNVEVVRKVHPLLDAEALRVVKKMPTWNPGIQRSKPVKTSFIVPINFVLK